MAKKRVGKDRVVDLVQDDRRIENIVLLGCMNFWARFLDSVGEFQVSIKSEFEKIQNANLTKQTYDHINYKKCRRCSP